MAPKKHVVIVGGGGAGAKLARLLSGQLDNTKYELTLISSHPYYVHYVAGIRTIVTDEGSLENKMLIPYDKLLLNGNGTIKQGTVTAIEAQKDSLNGGKIILEDGESVGYDVLVLSPGSKWKSFLDFPVDDEKTRQHLQEWRQKFRGAKKVVIAGGGAVGIELAGEIREFYPDSKVTIVHGDKKLLNPTYPDKFRTDVERRLRLKGVKLILDDFIDSVPASATRKGVKLDADLVVPALGPRPNTSWIASSLGKEVLTEQGFVRIRPTMQLDAYPSIFAIGDVIDFPEQKQVGKYGTHAGVAGANVQALLNGTQPQKQYKGQIEMIVLTIGKTGGAGFASILWGLMFGNWIVALLKSKGLLIGMMRQSLGQPA